MNKCDIVKVPYLLSLTFSCYLWVWCLIAFGAPMIKLSKGSTYIKPSCQQYVRKKETRKPFLWAFDNQRIGNHVVLLQYFWASVHIFCYFFLMRNRTRFVEKQGFSRVLEQLRFCSFQARKSLIHICMFNCLHKKESFWHGWKKWRNFFFQDFFAMCNSLFVIYCHVIFKSLGTKRRFCVICLLVPPSFCVPFLLPIDLVVHRDTIMLVNFMLRLPI